MGAPAGTGSVDKQHCRPALSLLARCSSKHVGRSGACLPAARRSTLHVVSSDGVGLDFPTGAYASIMPAFVIVETDVRDPEQYERYRVAAAAAIAASGGRYIAGAASWPCSKATGGRSE
jgi:Domain of unknown function (DUF1330)